MYVGMYVCLYVCMNMSVCNTCVHIRLQFIFYIVCFICCLFNIILLCNLMSVSAKGLDILLLMHTRPSYWFSMSFYDMYVKLIAVHLLQGDCDIVGLYSCVKTCVHAMDLTHRSNSTVSPLLTIYIYIYIYIYVIKDIDQRGVVVEHAVFKWSRLKEVTFKVMSYIRRRFQRHVTSRLDRSWCSKGRDVRQKSRDNYFLAFVYQLQVHVTDRCRSNIVVNRWLIIYSRLEGISTTNSPSSVAAIVSR